MVALAFFFGLLIGSFLNVCISRWPDRLSVVSPRSRCPKCKGAIAWYDNVPLLSYVLLAARCRSCKEPISWRYPTVEALNASVYALLAYQHGLQPFTFKAALFSSMMIILIFTDLEQLILPDEITLGGIPIGLGLALWVAVPLTVTRLIWLFRSDQPSEQLGSLAECLVAAVLFGGLLWAMREAYYRLRGVDGLGLGDVKMAAMMGAFWGVGQTLMILIIGSIAGAVIGTALIAIRRANWRQELPYGSYLGAAALVVTLFGDHMLGAYWGLVLPTGQ